MDGTGAEGEGEGLPPRPGLGKQDSDLESITRDLNADEKRTP